MIRKETSTTKVRVVYDASSREGKVGTSLNDCLHVGPSLNLCCSTYCYDSGRTERF